MASIKRWQRSILVNKSLLVDTSYHLCILLLWKVLSTLNESKGKVEIHQIISTTLSAALSVWHSKCLFSTDWWTLFHHLLVTVCYSASSEEAGGTWQIGDKNISICVWEGKGRREDGRGQSCGHLLQFNQSWSAAINRERETQRAREEETGKYICIYTNLTFYIWPVWRERKPALIWSLSSGPDYVCLTASSFFFSRQSVFFKTLWHCTATSRD